MLYYFFQYLDKTLDVPGTGVFQYITFRSGLAIILSLMISTIFGKRIINYLRRLQIGETVRELGLEGQTQKAGTPTMGGLIIIFSTLIPVLLLAKLDNIYVILLIVTTLWMGTIGFIDDYIKIFKKDKEGLKGRFKVIGQVGLGIIVGSVLYFHPGVTVRTDTATTDIFKEGTVMTEVAKEEKSTATTIPFFKNNEFDYAEILAWTGDNYHLRVANFYSGCDFYHHRRFQRRKSNRRNRRTGCGNIRHIGANARYFCLRVGEYHFFELPEHHVYPEFG